MDHLSAHRQRLWEAMESCRDGSDHLSDPQFADLAARLAEDPEVRAQFQRLKKADGAIKAAFADVPVPGGLADRVTRRLAEAAPTATPDSLAMSALTTREGPTPLPRPTERFSRCRLLVGFAALSAAAGLFASVWIQTHPSRHETPDSVLDEAMEFFGKDNEPFGPLVSQVTPPAEYPMGRGIAQRPDIRWRHVEKFPGGPALAYDLPTNSGRATLYVLQRNVPGLPPIPPLMPRSSTGGMSAAAWQTDSMLYVLVVEGDGEMYSRYLDHSHGPLT